MDDPLSRFMKYIKVNPETGCWEWTGSTDGTGYGKFYFNQRLVPSHRFSWEMRNGKIQDGLEVHHKCRNKLCCNPEHLSPITRREHNMIPPNVAGINARKTHCLNGHPYSGTNLYVSPIGRRVCRTCNKEKLRKRYVSHQRIGRTECNKGHSYSGKNLYVSPQGYRSCRICMRENQRKRYVPHPWIPKTHCPKGHLYAGSNLFINTHGTRECRICRKERRRERYVPHPLIRRTECHKGHSYSGANLYVGPKGWRICRTCRKEWQNQRYRRKQALLGKEVRQRLSKIETCEK